MATASQVFANRENSKLSTGPRTQEGKAASSHNATSHGPSAADPGRNTHRTGAGWTLGTVTTILENPRYTGRQVWNRQRTTPSWPTPPT